MPVPANSYRSSSSYRGSSVIGFGSSSSKASSSKPPISSNTFPSYRNSGSFDYSSPSIYSTYRASSSNRSSSSSSTSSSSSSSSSSLSSLASSYHSPSSYLTSLSSSSSSYYRPSSLLSTSGFSSTPCTVTLTRFNPRRSSIDQNDDDTDSLSSTKSSSSISYLSPLSRRKKYTLNDSIIRNPSNIAGLTNLGNTCYMNAILQSLYATEGFRNYVTKSRRGSLNSALGQLFEEMISSINTSVNPSSFRSAFTRIQPKFRGYEQQDAQEFFQYLINALHDEVNTGSFGSSSRNSKSPKSSTEAWERYRMLEDSPFVDLIAGQLSSTVTCSICGNASTCWDPFWDLSLPLPNNVRETDIERCLKEFTALEELSRDELAKCDRCDKPTKSTKRLSIEKAPQVLILHLKRFSNDGYKLTMPRVIANERIATRSKHYSLSSVVLHHGSSIRSGHYTAYSLHGSKWFHFNDERVTEIKNFSPSDAEDAYILFYVESSCSSRL